MEDDDVINTVEEFWAEVSLEYSRRKFCQIRLDFTTRT